jgi:hypothetical protein
MSDSAAPAAGFTARTSRRIPPPPPRITGDPEVDIAALRDWFQQFYQISVIETGLLDPTYQSGEVTIDLENLPDPVFSTISRAQGTANAIYAALIKGTQQSGRFTIAETDDEATITLDPPLADAEYRVLITPSDFSGTPLIDAFTLIRVTRAADAFAVLLFAAPGAGNTITFDYLVTART